MLLKDHTKFVFLSHTRKESSLAAAIAQILESEDCQVWYDRQSIESGSEMQAELQRALENADSMIALLGPFAYSSTWVREELKYALFQEKFKNRFLPVLIGDPSSEAFNKLPWILTQMNFISINPQDSEARSAELIVKNFKDLIQRSEQKL